MQSQPLAATRRFESRFTTTDGASLFRRAWLPPQPSVGLLLIHGFAEHSGRYDDFGGWFAARGCAVHSFDHRGHGHSPGQRNYVRRFDEFLDDVAAFERLVGNECAGLPLVLPNPLRFGGAFPPPPPPIRSSPAAVTRKVCFSAGLHEIDASMIR